MKRDGTARVKTKCGGLSTARSTMKPSKASVEMTIVDGGVEENRQRQKQIPAG
jgi:hypothetical protein